jgi:hypothetical protein
VANELSRRPNVSLIEAFDYSPPACSVQLQTALIAHLYPHPDIPQAVYPRYDVIEEAIALLHQMGQYSAPAWDDTILAWMWPIADAVEYTPTEDDFMRRVKALSLAARDIPHVAWTLEKQRQGIRTWRRLPSVAQIMELVLPPVHPMMRMVAALRQIANGVENPSATDHT